MSSLNRGATGAIKPKSVNVNTLFSGRNIAPGQRANGRYGLQSVGKTAGVVRRMPPPATLPSLKAENNGQDPSTQVVPQGGAGWSKSENPLGQDEVQPPTPSATVPASDLRPSWLVAPAEPTTNSSTREFPSLAPPSGTSEPKCNKWENPELQQKLLDMSAGDYSSNIPTRFLERSHNATAQKPTTKTKPTRIIGSQDVRYQHPELVQLKKYFQPKTLACDDEGFGSQDRTYPAEESSWSQNGSTSQAENYAATTKKAAQKEILVTKQDEEFKQSHRISDFRILKRTEQLLLQDISDEEEEVQMTRLDKPQVSIIKRKALNESNSSKEEPVVVHVPTLKSVPKPTTKEKKPAKKEWNKIEKVESFPVEPVEEAIETADVINEEVLPAPIPQENIWAKRKEERESQEREREKTAIPKVMQQAIEQHFPLVTDAATIKVDKESTRKASDTEFTRAAIRARKQATSNDVRRLNQNSEDNRGPRKNNNSRPEVKNASQEVQNATAKEPAPNGNKTAERTGKNQHNENVRQDNRNSKKVEETVVDVADETMKQERERHDSHRSNVSHDSARNGYAHRKGARGNLRARVPRANGKTNEPTESKKKVADGHNQRVIPKNENISAQTDKSQEEVEVKNEQAGNFEDSNESPEEFEEKQNNKNENTKEQDAKQASIRGRVTKQGNRLFVPKALRKESDDLPANGLLSPQNQDTKEKITILKKDRKNSLRKTDDEEAETDRGFNAIVTDIGNLVGKKNENEGKKASSPEENRGCLEFPKEMAKPSEAESTTNDYEFAFDPTLHNPGNISDKIALQQVISAVTANSDDATLKEKMNRIKDLWTAATDADRTNVAMVKPQPQIGDMVMIDSGKCGVDQVSQSCRNGANISLAPFSGHYNAFQPLYPNSEGRVAATAASPPSNYLGLYSGNPPKPQSFIDNSVLPRNSLSQQHNIWNGGHFDLSTLSGTPPPPSIVQNTNGGYGFFGSSNQTSEMRGFGPIGNPVNSNIGTSQPYFERQNLPPTNLAVGSQRQTNMYNNVSNGNQANRHVQLNGVGNHGNTNVPNGFPNYFTQPPPPVAQPQQQQQPQHNARYSNNTNQNDNCNGYYFNGPRPGNAPMPPPQMEIWGNSNAGYYGNVPPPLPPPIQQGNGGWAAPNQSNARGVYHQGQMRDQQMNRMRRHVNGGLTSAVRQ